MHALIIYVLDILKPFTLFKRRCYSEELFLRSISDGYIASPSFLGTVVIKIPIRTI
jgi:hypothetical protein